METYPVEVKIGRLLPEGREERGIAGSSDDEIGARVRLLDALPCVEQKINTFVREDQTLPEYKSGVGRYAKATENTLRLVDGKVVEERAVRDDGDAGGIDVELGDKSSLDGSGVADDAVDEVIEILKDGVMLVRAVVRQKVVDGKDDLCAATFCVF